MQDFQVLINPLNELISYFDIYIQNKLQVIYFLGWLLQIVLFPLSVYSYMKCMKKYKQEILPFCQNQETLQQKHFRENKYFYRILEPEDQFIKSCN